MSEHVKRIADAVTKLALAFEAAGMDIPELRVSQKTAVQLTEMVAEARGSGVFNPNVLGVGHIRMCDVKITWS